MIRIATCFLLLFLILSGCESNRQLTRSKAKSILDKIAAQTSITRITIDSDQLKKLNSAGPNITDSVDVKASKVCLPDRSDVRVTLGRLALCEGVIPPNVTWQHPGVLVQLKKPIVWTLVEVTGIADAPSQNEKTVEYTWEFNFSPFPKEVQDALKLPPRPGKSLLRLYDDGWRFVEFQ